MAGCDFDGDGYSDLAIEVTGENFEGGSFSDNGAMHAMYGSPGVLSSDGEQFHGQGVWGAGATEDGDRFGSVLVAGDFDFDGVDALAIGVPNEDRPAGSDAGVVVVITGRGLPIFADEFESGDASAWTGTPP